MFVSVQCSLTLTVTLSSSVPAVLVCFCLVALLCLHLYLVPFCSLVRICVCTSSVRGRSRLVNVALVYCSFKSLLTVQSMSGEGEGEEAPCVLNVKPPYSYKERNSCFVRELKLNVLHHVCAMYVLCIVHVIFRLTIYVYETCDPSKRQHPHEQHACTYSIQNPTSPFHKYVHIHMHTHTCTHMHTTCTQHMHAHTHYTCTNTHARTHAHTHARTHTHTH